MYFFNVLIYSNVHIYSVNYKKKFRVNIKSYF